MADLKWSLILFLFFNYIVSLSATNRYSESLNFQDDKMTRPFRMNKVNLVWMKARKHLSPQKLTKLYSELKIQDEAELKLKHLKVDNQDLTGDYEAATRTKLQKIMVQFGLDDFEDLGKNFHQKKAENEINRPESWDTKLDDQHLKNLWNKAQESHFNDIELDNLKIELQHQQQKINEYRQLKNEINELHEISENSIGDLHKAGTNPGDLNQKKQQLKEKHREMAKGSEKMDIMSQMIDDAKNTFTDPRVYDLWVDALKTNMTKKELWSLKEELQHFNKKIQKLGYYKEQAQLIKEKVDDPLKTNRIPHDNNNFDMEDRVKDYRLKVKKLERDLRNKIDKAASRHSEL